MAGSRFLEAFEALKRAVAWEIQTEQAVARSGGSPALEKIHAQAAEEVIEAAKRLVCMSDAPGSGE